MSLKTISLFTGCGGLDYGFEAAGYETAVAVELDETCCASLRANRSWPVIGEDACGLSGERLLEGAGLSVREADVLVGGPPCQPFSKSGWWASGDTPRMLDPRASTLEAYLRLLGETLPRAFLLENVEGLGFRGKDEGLKAISAALTEINRRHGTSYSVSIAILNAADYGVPQVRRRLIIVGSRDGLPFEFPHPTHAARPQGDDTQPWLTAWDALYDLPDPADARLKARGKWADLLPSIPEGANYLWHTDRGGGVPLFGWRTRYWSFLLKLAKDQPSWTIQAQPGPATGPFHWDSRRLSDRELARLQTFPDDVSLKGDAAAVRRQIGNAVPSLLAEVLARAIRTQLLGQPASSTPTLALSRADSSPPPPAGPSAVPERFLALKGQHEDHPGTGRGPGASTRGTVEAPLGVRAEQLLEPAR